jgi:hypothetical protein
MSDNATPQPQALAETARALKELERIVRSHESIVKMLGLKGDAAILAVAEATLADTDVNILELYGIDEKALRERVMRKMSDAGIADAFLSELMSLPDHIRRTCMEERMHKMAVRLPQAIEALKLQGHEYDQMELRRQLRNHPAFIASNRSHRGIFGSLRSSLVKVWVFAASIPVEATENREATGPLESP